MNMGNNAMINVEFCDMLKFSDTVLKCAWLHFCSTINLILRNSESNSGEKSLECNIL